MPNSTCSLSFIYLPLSLLYALISRPAVRGCQMLRPTTTCTRGWSTNLKSYRDVRLGQVRFNFYARPFSVRPKVTFTNIPSTTSLHPSVPLNASPPPPCAATRNTSGEAHQDYRD